MFIDEEKGFFKAVKEKPMQLQDCFVKYAEALQDFPKWGGTFFTFKF